MSRHDLQVSTTRRPEVITPTVVDGSATVAQQSSDLERFSQADRGVMAKTAVTGAVEIAKMYVSTKCDIEKIRANAEAEVSKIREQIERLKADASAYIEKAKADNANWHSQFDKKAAIMREARDWVEKRLEQFPNCSDEVKIKIMEFALWQFK